MEDSGIKLGFIGIAIVFFLLIVFTPQLSFFYTVDADEIGVIKQFGKVVRQTVPGLHFKLPFLIETNKNVPVRKVFKEEFGFRTLEAGVRTEYDTAGNFSAESLLLTGDLNSADVEWVIQYKIKNPIEYLYHVRNPTNILRDLSEVVMSKIIGDRTVTEVLTVGRIEIANEVKTELQTLLDTYQSGLHVTTVTLQDVNPPEEVKAAFNEVNQSRQQKEQLINEAWRDYNQSVPKAKGLASKMISEAEGYAIQRINKAQGDADRFNAINDEYQKAKVVTRKRLYLEAMQDVLPHIKEIYIIDTATQSLIPFLQMNK